MARKPRIHFPGALYHVISRGNRRQVIFRDEGDYERYERIPDGERDGISEGKFSFNEIHGDERPFLLLL